MIWQALETLANSSQISAGVHRRTTILMSPSLIVDLQGLTDILEMVVLPPVSCSIMKQMRSCR